jgi:lipopolysaccharide/colanic/teichoic acid biosynthesis glycosyltransferase
MNKSLVHRFPGIKYFIERILAVFLLLAALPLIIILALISVLQVKEFPFFSQYRSLNLSDKKFIIYKIRTLKSSNELFNCENVLIKRELNKLTGGICGWMRKTGLDELPQLINVIRGEMSLVGPRPLNNSDLCNIRKNFPEFYTGREKLNVKPGITGLWQVYGKREKGIAELIELDRQYAMNISFFLDMKIIFSTIDMLLLGKKSDSIML